MIPAKFAGAGIGRFKTENNPPTIKPDSAANNVWLIFILLFTAKITDSKLSPKYILIYLKTFVKKENRAKDYIKKQVILLFISQYSYIIKFER